MHNPTTAQHRAEEVIVVIVLLNQQLLQTAKRVDGKHNFQVNHIFCGAWCQASALQMAWEIKNRFIVISLQDGRLFIVILVKMAETMERWVKYSI